MDEVELRPLGPADEAAAEALLDATMAGRHQSRLGESHDVLALDTLGAWDGDRLVAVASWSPPDHEGRSELAALAVTEDRQGQGIGALLVDAVAMAVTASGAQSQWLVTTNDNLDALRLYQRHGYHLAQLHGGAVDKSRRDKPTIPTVGRYGIPLRDELVLERPLT
jgi:ribosomal protein S18 acetylase RimI-like enzyme